MCFGITTYMMNSDKTWESAKCEANVTPSARYGKKTKPKAYFLTSFTSIVF